MLQKAVSHSYHKCKCSPEARGIRAKVRFVAPACQHKHIWDPNKPDLVQVQSYSTHAGTEITALDTWTCTMVWILIKPESRESNTRNLEEET